MNNSQFSSSDLTSFIRRRMKHLIIFPVVVTILCIIGAKMIPRQYESSTTIWVQPDETLNPLINYQIAMQTAPPDRLATFLEIIESRETIEAVIDSVGLNRGVPQGAAFDDLVEEMRRNINSSRKGADSFTISYMDTDPVRAQRVVACLARTFIQTRINGEALRNAQTVEFFEQKLKDYQAKFESTQQDMVGLLTQRMRERPGGNGALNVHLEDLDQQVQHVDEKSRIDQDALTKLALFPEKFRTPRGKQAIEDLRRTDLPFANELRSACQQYEELSSRYTPLYPDVQKAEGEILAVLRKMRTAVETEQATVSAQVAELRSRRQHTIGEMMNYSVDQQEDVPSKSNYNMYQKLYEDMKTKLEQAKITRDLGKKAESSFIILDPARVAFRPSKPNRVLIVGGGAMFGIILGIAVALIAEFMDTRMRTLRDLEIYDLPIVALLPEITQGR